MCGSSRCPRCRGWSSASPDRWGLEDSDLLIRLLHAGVRRKDGNFATGVLHLWHPENDRSYLPQNQRRLDTAERADRIGALAGLSSLGNWQQASRQPEQNNVN